MIAYATRTGTRRNLRLLDEAGWRLLLTPDARWLGDWAGGYALDNGVWGAHQQERPWEPGPFLELLRKHGASADWAVLPDIVAGGAQSLALSVAWRDRVLAHSKQVLLAVQDGMKPADVAQHLGPRVGVFVGGSTEWKLATLRQWGEMGQRLGVWVHVGRVNTVRRILRCVRAGVASIDGTSASRYAKTLPTLDSARRQLALGGLG